MALGEELQLIISGDPTKLKNALGQAGGQVDKFAEKVGKIGRTMTIVGGAVTAALGMIVKKTMDVGDQFDKMSLRTGVAVEDLSTLAYAADICGTDIGTVENSLRFLAKGMKETSDGTGIAKDAFEELDISVMDSEGNLRDTVDVMKEAATKLAGMGDSARQSALAGEIFGSRYGTQLLPLLKQGGKGIEELMQKARELNLEISTESAAASATFKDTLGDLTKSTGSLGREIGEILIPSLTKLAEKAVEVVKRITEWVKEHPKLVEWIVKVGGILGGLAAVGGPILIAVSAFMKMKLAIAAIGTVASGPIGIIIAAVIGLALAWTTNFGGIRDFTLKVVEKVKEALGWLWDKVIWVAEKLGLIKKPIEDVALSADELKEANAELAIATEEAGKKAGEAATPVDTLADSVGELGNKTDEAKTALDEFGNKIETFDEWVERLAEESEEANEKMAKAAEDAYKKYTDAMKPVEDRLYELSHTEEEVAAKKLQLEREKAEATIIGAELGKEKEEEELKKVKEVYEAEINIIIAKIEEKKQKEIEAAGKTEETAAVQERAIHGIGEKWDELIGKVNAYENAVKEAAKIKWEAETPTIGETGYVPPYVPELQLGTSRVPRTGLYKLDIGERVTPAAQNTYDQRKKEINININNPVVRNDNDITQIKQQVEMAFWEFVRQYGRSGFELSV